MKYLAAYLLCTIGGNASPNADEITAVLSSVGIEADGERVKTLLKELEGKDINQLITEGSQKLASVPSGGASAGGGAPAAAGASGGAAAPKEEEKEEEKEESDEDMGFGLFD